MSVRSLSDSSVRFDIDGALLIGVSDLFSGMINNNLVITKKNTGVSREE